jgi:hypothetical protein
VWFIPLVRFLLVGFVTLVGALPNPSLRAPGLVDFPDCFGGGKEAGRTGGEEDRGGKNGEEVDGPGGGEDGGLASLLPSMAFGLVARWIERSMDKGEDPCGLY